MSSQHHVFEEKIKIEITQRYPKITELSAYNSYSCPIITQWNKSCYFRYFGPVMLVWYPVCCFVISHWWFKIVLWPMATSDFSSYFCLLLLTYNKNNNSRYNSNNNNNNNMLCCYSNALHFYPISEGRGRGEWDKAWWEFFWVGLFSKYVR